MAAGINQMNSHGLVVCLAVTFGGLAVAVVGLGAKSSSGQGKA